MSANVINQVPYLRTSREFPEELQQLTVEVNRAYIDTATKVNDRTIGLYPTNRPAVTGNSYYLVGNRRQQSIRQVYRFTSFTSPLSIPHGIPPSDIFSFANIYGTATDGTNWYPLPYVDVVAANNQIKLVVTPTNIVITAGAGAPPAITSGIIILEWITNA
jgi:hypothetical protein